MQLFGFANIICLIIITTYKVSSTSMLLMTFTCTFGGYTCMFIVDMKLLESRPREYLYPCLIHNELSFDCLISPYAETQYSQTFDLPAFFRTLHRTCYWQLSCDIKTRYHGLPFAMH